ncbi:XRE family transcriptional regulator [Fusobacterium necrophorum]|uniref:HTH cro/C1-type domain-containing protein n=1 Tax=Fusobacterium necrophorum BL TaxID=1441732 RepID=A0AB73BWZ5_9FUSO|nr:helix-turn-helix domain-containing protein [Fusobacterium necrophorum]AYZ73442.1 XRE family transcriptional regulator [Fusobacterium necrophorum]AZW08561.1 XRE family transcriptional regulator [Fusobacterium necrophorum subsp. necrophorum]KDE63798.1 hypothetical protein FUSO3_04545 [Fusobacterium necrophorum BL]KDE72269.1 DNA-binding protein [Fusobacterium necrophorum BFTR-2]SDB40963.1 hypothetical protein SAMN02983009_01960 [Fusobacterium necrophorum]
MYVKLKQFMVEKSLKNKDLADLLDISYPCISKKLNQKGSDFTVKEVKCLCEKYGLDANLYFFS